MGRIRLDEPPLVGQDRPDQTAEGAAGDADRGHCAGASGVVLAARRDCSPIEGVVSEVGRQHPRRCRDGPRVRSMVPGASR
jgi:hypothetical protein